MKVYSPHRVERREQGVEASERTRVSGRRPYWYQSSEGCGLVSEAALDWARGQLGVRNLTPVRTRPWATLWSTEDGSGTWWLKVSAPGTGHEARLLQLLAGLG
jgi:hypothetical protein